MPLPVLKPLVKPRGMFLTYFQVSENVRVRGFECKKVNE
jgi:hypothetical protein